MSTAVIGKVCKRGSDVRRLLGYLFREGLAGEHGLTASHSAPRLIAAWDGTDGLEPRRTAGGGRDLRHLAGALNAPLLAAGLDRKDWPGARPVYHLAIAAADDDQHLTDEQWADIAAEYVDQIGLAPRRDDEAVLGRGPARREPHSRRRDPRPAGRASGLAPQRLLPIEGGEPHRRSAVRLAHDQPG